MRSLRTACARSRSIARGRERRITRILERNGALRIGPFDAAACPRASLSDLSDEKLADFLGRARTSRGYALAPDTPMAKAPAQHMNLLDRGQPGHAAVLLFGDAPQRFLPTSEAKCLHFHGTEVRKPIPSYQIYKALRRRHGNVRHQRPGDHGDISSSTRASQVASLFPANPATTWRPVP